MDYVTAFLIGGAICAIVQVIMDNTKLLPGRIMVGLVCAGAILSFFGLYEPFADWAKSGASVESNWKAKAKSSPGSLASI